MPRIKLSEEFKEAIRRLTPKEKDKLLFKLLPKEQKLVHQLEFKLLENEKTTEARRDKIKTIILDSFENYPKQYHSPSYLVYNLKNLSGKINYHTAITKDKVGEIELNLLMLNEILGKNIDKLITEDKWQIRKLAEHVVARINKLHGLIGKLHEDYLLEFEQDIDTLKSIINKLPLFAKIAEDSDIELELLK